MENKEPNINFCGPESTVESGRTEQVDVQATQPDVAHTAESAHLTGTPFTEPAHQEAQRVDLDEVKQRFAQTRDRVKERVKEQALDAMSTRKENAANALSDMASALHCAADRLHEGHRDAIGNYTAKAAERVEHFCSTLRERDFESLLHDAEDLARSRPGFFLGGAVTLGFLAARFMKSATPHAEWQGQPREQLYPDTYRGGVPAEPSSTETAYTGGEAI